MTKKHQQHAGDEIYQTKDGRTFDNYSDFVQAKRELNKQRLQALGLTGPLLGGSSSKQQQRPVQKVSPGPQPTSRSMRPTQHNNHHRVSPSPPQTKRKTRSELILRRSTRVRGIAAPQRILLEEPQAALFAPRKKQRRAVVGTKPSESFSLTPEQRQQLRWSESWLDDMQTYLIEKEHLSSQNLRSVMRQVEKLVSGVGVTYQHWPPGVVFGGAGQQVTLHDDFEALHANAVEFEHRHGRDRGNGWLLRHPITKLARYQRHLSSTKK